MEMDFEQFPCLNKNKALERFRHLIKISTSLMPHQVAAATGCDIRESIAILMFLVTEDKLKPFILVYHNNHDDDIPLPIMKRNFIDGYPKLPFICDGCEKEIVSRKELSYDLMFEIIENMEL